jgi:peptide/nickel transport system substrate-binding protein
LLSAFSFLRVYRTKALNPALLIAAAWLAGGCGESPSDQGGPGTSLRSVPRNRTLIMDCSESNICGGQILDYNSFNPFLAGTTSRTGYNFLYEPLYFYNAFKDEVIPWIATGHEFNEDYTEVSIDIRPGVEWSDGMPWTAHDLVFTINMLKGHAPTLTYSTDMENWVAEAVAVDSLTAKITLTAPNPRFVFSYFTAIFGIGIPIVPEHIWRGKDPNTFANFDLAQGLPVVSGPYKMALSSPQQRIWDVRRDWWGKKTAFAELPAVERIIYLPYMEEAKRVQNLIANNMDTSLDLRPPNIQTVLDRNPRVTTWTGRKSPLGYIDFWPISLGFNVLKKPFDNPEIRRAINHAINREQLVEIGWQGAGASSLLPFPDYPALKPYFGAVQDLLEKSEIGLFSLEKSAEIMRAQGWQRADGEYWSKGGVPFKIVIDIFPIFNDLAPVLVAQLEQAGFDADFRMTSDAYTRMAQGEAHAFINGHGGSVRDPYFTLRLYHSRFVQPTGTSAEYFWRWSNENFDWVVDEMAQVAPGDKRLTELYREAMEIWLAELPSIPLVQWYHRIPHNEMYWTNWPSEKNPYMNSAYWHRGWLLVLLNLRPTQG